MTLRILISGASIAGCAAAWTLARQGHDVRVIERAPEFRDGGQNIDVRGVGRDVLRRMGLEAAALASGTGESGTAWIREDGTIAAEFPLDASEGDGPTAELEILRGDLARLIHAIARGIARFEVGRQIDAIDTSEAEAHVRFKDGDEDTFDLVIVAEGVGSATRELAFPKENDPRWMDLTIAYFTIPRQDDDDRLWRWYHATGGRSISLRPDNKGTARAMLSVQGPPEGKQDWNEAEQKRWLREQFQDAGWQAERVLAGMESTEDFYFDVQRQVRMPRWHRGRIVLTGDAAWCATPLAGIGATLALTGAYVLAGEIGRSESLARALDNYEDAMRPMVEKGQGVPKMGPRLMNPHSRLGIALLHGALGIASQPPLRGLASSLIGERDQKAPDLSRYDSDGSISG